jgi:arsenate reductase-like glutaredoxin family protein
MVMFYCSFFPGEGIGNLELQPEDVVISSDTSIKEFNPYKKLSKISNSALAIHVLAAEKAINRPMLLV